MATTVVFQPNEASAVDNYLHTSIGVSPTDGKLQVGHSGGTLVRSVFVWDLTSLPAGAIVTSASLTLTEFADEVTSTQTIRTYRLTQAGVTESCTWATYDGSNAWTTAGGDYSTAITSTQTTDGGTLVISDAGFVNLANDALNNRSGLLRIILATQEELDGVTSGTQRMKYNSASVATASDRPKLTVTYTRPATWVGGTGLTLTSASAWSTGEVPTSNVARFSSGYETGKGTVTLGSCLIGNDFEGGLGTSATSASISTDLVLIDNMDGSLYLDVDVPLASATDGLAIIRRFPQVTELNLELGSVYVFAQSDYRRGNGKLIFGSSTDITTLHISNTSSQHLAVQLGGTIDNITVSGPVRLTGSATVSGTMKVIGPAAHVDCDASVAGDVMVTGAVAVFGGDNLASSGTLEVSRSNVSLSGDDVSITVGDLIVSTGGAVTVDSNGGATFNSITALSGRLNSTTPHTLTVGASAKLSSTNFRSLDFSSSRNSGHFVGITT